MTDALFRLYGGEFEASTPPQRLLAYEIAEELISQHLGTPLSPTVYTGTFVNPVAWDRISLPHTNLRSVLSVIGLFDGTTTTEATGTAYIQDAGTSVIQLVPPAAVGCFGCTGEAYGTPQRFRVVYEAGLASGTITNDKRAMLALKIQSQQVLDQIVDPSAAEGGAGNPGVQNWSEAGHSETRIELLRTTFGTSALDNYTVMLLKHLRKTGAMRL